MALWISRAVVHSEDQNRAHGAMDDSHRRMHSIAREIVEAIEEGRSSEVPGKRENRAECFKRLQKASPSTSATQKERY